MKKQNKKSIAKILFFGLVFTLAFFNVRLAIEKDNNGIGFTKLSLEMATVAYAEGGGLENGRPLKSNGSGYCCENSGNDCGAACC